MAKRQELIKFASFNGLQIKGDKQGIVTAFNPKNNWVECFDNWEQAYNFFMQAVESYRFHGKIYPWQIMKKSA